MTPAQKRDADDKEYAKELRAAIQNVVRLIRIGKERGLLVQFWMRGVIYPDAIGYDVGRIIRNKRNLINAGTVSVEDTDNG